LKRHLPYLRFQRKATNRHGVHSPFIYQFLEDVVYDKKYQSNLSIKNRQKEFALYLRLFSYYNIKSAFISKIDHPFKQLFNEYLKINSEFTTESYNPKKTQVSCFDVFITNPTDNQYDAVGFVTSIKEKNNSIVIIPQIRASKEQFKLWEDFKNLESTRVSLEFYYFGLIFFRKENSPEHFKIRF